MMALIGLIKSLMTLNLIDELTDNHGHGNRECVAQGTANIVNGFFGGMGEVMLMVVIGTFAWSTFKIINKIPITDVVVIAVVTIVTVIADLAIAVLAGIIISALVFAWQNALRIRARKRIDEHGIKHYEIYGALFFGSTKLFHRQLQKEIGKGGF